MKGAFELRASSFPSQTFVYTIVSQESWHKPGQQQSVGSAPTANTSMCTGANPAMLCPKATLTHEPILPIHLNPWVRSHREVQSNPHYHRQQMSLDSQRRRTTHNTPPSEDWPFQKTTHISPARRTNQLHLAARPLHRLCQSIQESSKRERLLGPRSPYVRFLLNKEF